MLRLSKLNLHPLIATWIASFLHGRQKFVSENDYPSAFAPVISDVSQGSVLGPSVFLIFISDMPTAVSYYIRLFAGDCVLHSWISNATRVDSSILKNSFHRRTYVRFRNDAPRGKCHQMSLNENFLPILPLHLNTSFTNLLVVPK